MTATRIRRILVPTDFSYSAQAALEWAKAQARRLGAEIGILHVMPVLTAVAMEGPADGQADPAAMRLIDRISAVVGRSMTGLEQRPEITARFFRMGDPREEIVRVAQLWGADLIVMGAHGGAETSSWRLGSVARYVLRHADVPVLLVRGVSAHTPANAGKPAVSLRPHWNDASAGKGAPAVTRAGEMFADLRHTSRLETHPGGGGG